MDTNTKATIVSKFLANIGAQPSFPPITPLNQSEDGVHGDALCPFADMHTTKDPEGTRSLRIFLDRLDPEYPENGGKVFCSCRHNTCQPHVWEELTRPIRRLISPGSGQVGMVSPKSRADRAAADSKMKTQNQQKATDAIAGRSFTESILNDVSTLNTTEEDIMKLSPFPIKPGAAERLPFLHSQLLLSMFHSDDLVYWGEVEDARNPQSIRTRREWLNQLEILQKSVACQEAPHLWPWAGRFTTGSTFLTNTGGRNLLNMKERRFVVCESDTLGKKDQLRVIKTMINDKRFAVAYVLFSGSKSYHIGLKSSSLGEREAAFLTGIAGSQVPKELIKTRTPVRFGGMGFDPMTTREVQPVRIPGPVHPKTGKMQRLLYIDPTFGYEL